MKIISRTPLFENKCRVTKIRGETDGRVEVSNKTLNTAKIYRSHAKNRNLPFVAFVARFPKTDFLLRLLCSQKPLSVKQATKIHQAHSAINGGFWDASKKALDWCVIKGKTITKRHNAVRHCVVFTKDGIEICDPNEAQKRLHKTKTKENYSLLQAGPLLLKNGNANFDYEDFRIHADQFDSDITKDRHPRSFFGQNEREYFFVAINGRSRKSAGLFLEECAELAIRLGIKEALNLDGGASSTLVVKGKMYNQARFSFVGSSRYLSMRLPWGQRKIPNFIGAFEKD